MNDAENDDRGKEDNLVQNNNNKCDSSRSSFFGIDECSQNDFVKSGNKNVELSMQSVDSDEDMKTLKSTVIDEEVCGSLSPSSPIEDDVSFSEHVSHIGKKNNDSVNDDIKVPKKKVTRSGPGRGRPRKSVIPMYHSQISEDKNTIKIRIKKNNCYNQSTSIKKKNEYRKKQKVKSDTDFECGISKKRKRLSAQAADDFVFEEPLEQTVWGNMIPENMLFKIFEHCCEQDGALPILVQLSKVCKLWNKVALEPSLWIKVDLTSVKEWARTELLLHWIIHNRLSHCQDLTLGEWKIRDIQAALEALCETCQDLRGLNISGWQGLGAENLKYITSEYKKLERLDLSYINSNSAVNAQMFVMLGQTMNVRLTHLVLAHNKMASFTQIVASIVAHCPNLQLLDISNIKTFAHNTALLHIEKLQLGCPRLRVLRITNSQIWLSPTTITEQVSSPGFPLLEELSLAGVEDDKTTTSRSADDDAIERILKCSKKLRLLDIRGCTKLTASGLVKVPAWDLEHLFLSGCYITRTNDSGLELIVQKWNHSLLEVDLAWSSATTPLDLAVTALAEKGSDSKIRVLNLCGSSVSLEPVKAVLQKCQHLQSINLQSCRALPRGIKRLYTGRAVAELRQSLGKEPKAEQSNCENKEVHSHNDNVALRY